MSRDQALFWNCNRVKLCERKFLSAVLLKIMIFKLMLNFKPGDTSETIFLLMTQWHRRLRRKIRATCVIVKSEAKRRYQSDPIRSDPIRILGPVSRKSRKLFGPEKPFVKLQAAYSVKLGLWYVVKGIKIKITVKFRASRRLRFEDKNRIMSAEMPPKSFGTFEKRAPGSFCFLVILAWSHQKPLCTSISVTVISLVSLQGWNKFCFVLFCFVVQAHHL